jgi:glucosyl-3-phosphoglycerate synthase
LGGMEDRAEAWFRQRTTHWHDWPREQLMRWKNSRGARISVVIPARDEEATVGDVVGAIAAAFMTCKPLVDELVVMDSDSRDRTAEVAARAGATVYRCREVAEGLGAYPGKGEALWKSLQVTTGDILVFLDADLTRWGTHFVTGLLGPLLDPAQQTLLVKACYDRAGDGQPTAAGSRNWWRARS